jgi:hypothetical protein
MLPHVRATPAFRRIRRSCDPTRDLGLLRNLTIEMAI